LRTFHFAVEPTCRRVTKGRRTRSSAAFRSGGTESSNPASSSGESANSRSLLKLTSCRVAFRERALSAGGVAVSSTALSLAASDADGFERVFEIGPAFRAEPSFTTRHETEFTSVDMELSWIDSHDDVMQMEERWLAHSLAGSRGGRTSFALDSRWCGNDGTGSCCQFLPRLVEDHCGAFFGDHDGRGVG
jgi:hypothetical protein